MKTERVTMPVYGLGYGVSGALAAESAISPVVGVIRVYVNAETETAYLEYDLHSFKFDQLVVAVEQAGYRLGAVRHH